MIQHNAHRAIWFFGKRESECVCRQKLFSLSLCKQLSLDHFGHKLSKKKIKWSKQFFFDPLQVDIQKTSFFDQPQVAT
jgi:hypothetical protein